VSDWPKIDAELHLAGIRIAPTTPCSTDGPRLQCGTHVPHSEHYEGRARDYGDHASDCEAIANHLRPYAQGPGHILDELFYAPTGDWWKNGTNLLRNQIGDHDDHVHAGIVAGASFPVQQPPQPPTHYPEDGMTSTPIRIPLDAADGTGWAYVEIPKAKIVAIEVNGMNIEGKPAGGRGRSIVCDSLAWGTGARIVMRASAAGAGSIDATIWSVG
jgi:hypothetical protein